MTDYMQTSKISFVIMIAYLFCVLSQVAKSWKF